MSTLLTREEFRRQVFARDGGRCVICGAAGEDAHHIVERRLFDDGGYYLDNGATLCAACHVRAEMTVIACDAIRTAIHSGAGSGQVVLPPHLYPDQEYDKWGNPILPNGQRLRGELFDDGSVQKILAAGGVLGEFTTRVRYPRTYHLPWSPGATDDDRVLPDVRHFEGQEVVVTAKMDGEQTTMYTDYLHARSIDWSRHPSRSLGGQPARPGGLEDPAGLARVRREPVCPPFDPLPAAAGVFPGVLDLERTQCVPGVGGDAGVGGVCCDLDSTVPVLYAGALGRGAYPQPVPAHLERRRAGRVRGAVGRGVPVWAVPAGGGEVCAGGA